MIVNGIRTIYLRGVNKEFSSKFSVGSWVQHGTHEEGRRTYQLKHCEYNDEDEDNSPNIPSDKKRPISCLLMMWKILIVLIREEIFYPLKTMGYFLKNKKHVAKELEPQMTYYI